ncbi:hypothetical protein BGZ65_002106 [Modicella reniformis]|uniref:Uncharacterized protein n=1 Tax=Modicella reniformis TaxID=1440133 RepID=A0A9P6SMP0_9FUNG|nr:hypothetical protein BGZ65_002106 [Modicella reniformis]
MSLTTGDTKSVQEGSAGGHLTKKQRKEQFEALNALQTQLDVSISLARNKVSSWLNADAFSDDEDTSDSGGFTASTVIKPRQPGLGLGARFISHKDQMRHVPLNTFESKLKRQLTGGIVQSEIQRAEAAEKNALPDKYMEHKMMMTARRKELQEQAEDEEDSRTRNIGSGSSTKAGPLVNVVKSVVTSRSEDDTFLSQSPSQKIKSSNQKIKYQATVHPAVLKVVPSEHALEPSSSSSVTKARLATGKKRPADFFSMYMDERANKLARKR